MLVSVVVPVHNEVEVLPRFQERLLGVLEGLDADFEVIFVEDSSTDGTWPLLREVCERDKRIRALRLSRSFGHQGRSPPGCGPPRATS